MNNDPNSDPNSTPSNQNSPEVADMPIFDKEPTTDPSQPAAESSAAVELNSPAPDSPFGPPIESLSTGPSFSGSVATPDPVIPPTPVASGPVNQTPGIQPSASVSDAPLGVPVSPPTPVAEPSVVSPQPAVDMADSSIPTPVTPISSDDAQPKTKKRTLGLWISLAVVVLLLAGVVAIYFFM